MFELASATTGSEFIALKPWANNQHVSWLQTATSVFLTRQTGGSPYLEQILTVLFASWEFRMAMLMQ